MIRIATWGIGPIFVVRPQSMDAEICCWFSSFGVATAVSGVAIRTGPLHLPSRSNTPRHQYSCSLSYTYIHITYNCYQKEDHLSYYLLNEVEEMEIVWNTKNRYAMEQQKRDRYPISGRLHLLFLSRCRVVIYRLATKFVGEIGGTTLLKLMETFI